MEEIYKLTSRGLDEYLENEKYVQAEDLISACNLNILSSSVGIMCSMYEVRGLGEKPNDKNIRKDLQIIVEHIGILAHCLDIEIPELEELEEYFEDEVMMSLKMDVTMACTNINFITSNITLEYFSTEFGDEDLVDKDMLQVGILDMITSVMAMCSRLKYDFIDVIVRG
jgi:hypothetical protein